MDSNQESLNERVRETIAGLPDDKLSGMLMADSRNYTPFARQVAEEELARRRNVTLTKSPAFRVEDAGARIGCCIEFWTDKNFKGECLRIQGPAEYSTLDFAGLKWGDRISSIRVGTYAFVMMYADRNFEGSMLSLGPGQEVADLKDMQFDDEIDSIRLVNSMKVFDGSRAEQAKADAPESAPRKRQPKSRGRRKR